MSAAFARNPTQNPSRNPQCVVGNAPSTNTYIKPRATALHWADDIVHCGTKLPTHEEPRHVHSPIGPSTSSAAGIFSVSNRTDHAGAKGIVDPLTLLDGLPGMAYRRKNSPEWPMQHVSGGAAALCGYGPQALLAGQPHWGDLIHPEDRGLIWQSVQEALAQGTRFEIKYRLVTRDKRYKWVWERGKSVGSNGQNQLIEGFITDISPLRQKELELERSIAFSNAIVDGAAEGIALIDNSFCIESLNKAAEAMFEVESSAVVGNHVRDLFSSANFELLESEFTQVSESGGARLFSSGVEVIGRRASGSFFPMHINVREITFEGGRSYTAIIRDVTEQKAREEEILRQNERLKATIEFSPLGICMIDKALRITAANPALANMLGFDEQNMIGSRFPDFYHPEDIDEAEQALIEILSGRSSHYSNQSRYMHKDGYTVPVAISVAVGHDSAGNPEFAVVNVHDLTVRQEAQARIQELQEQITRLDRLSLLGETMAGVAHEINQPLTAISSYAQAGLRFLDPQNPKPERLKEAFTKLSEQVRRAGAIVERMRGLARRQVSASELVNSNDLLVQVEELAVADTRARGARIRLELQEGLPSVWCDPVQIQQVVLNLIRNAVDAMRSNEFQQGNEIVLRTSITDDGAIKISVTDYGTGVSSEVAKRLFRPFSTDSHIGLGLSICRSIVTAHGGQLDYYNNPHLGATFFLTLPQPSGDIEYES